MLKKIRIVNYNKKLYEVNGDGPAIFRRHRNNMEDLLKGKTVLIGRESGKGNLCVAIEYKGKLSGVGLGNPGSVPNCVSRCKDGKCHFKLEISDTGVMRLVHVKEGNVTYVNGIDVQSKRVYEDSCVELGKDKYRIDLKQVVDAAGNLMRKLAGVPPVPGPVQAPGPGYVKPPKPAPAPSPVFSIRHLEYVWQDYQDGLKALQKRQQKLNTMRSITPVFTIGGGLVATLCKTMDIGGGESDIIFFMTVAMSVIGVVLMIYSIVAINKADFMGRREALTDKFQDNYVCPNPECHHFMGNQPYKILKQNKKCPYCHANHVDA